MAAPTVNQRILTRSIRTHVDVQRYANGVAQDFLRLLNSVDADLVGKIQARLDDLGPVPDQVFGQGKDTTQRLQALLAEVKAINSDAYSLAADGGKVGGVQVPGIYDKLSALSTRVVDVELSLMDAVLPVNLTFTRPDPRLLRSLVTDAPFDGKLLSKAIENLEGVRANALERVLRRGVAEGRTNEQLIREIVGTPSIQGVLPESRVWADSVARTYTSFTSNRSRQAFFAENDDIISGEMWVATLDDRTCPECQELDGKAWKNGERPPAYCPVHYRCRCTTVAVLRSWQDMGIDLSEMDSGTRASMNGQIPAKMTYNDWLREQDAETQDSVLGKRRGDWFRKNPDEHISTAWAMSFQVRPGDRIESDQVGA